ncbi:hypothetical protein BDP27DRAFT_1386682 [Rhodocollybia butyracea]|uniref:Uncharacterized protein n=1 Tax=Rhodocollybia butyracea TaxID=206335 RepID=A0A9P5P5C9_9AGAR|nr:hypothetical protein BDP27DRAFT_1386682 [Rhodocollybia butyracea]
MIQDSKHALKTFAIICLLVLISLFLAIDFEGGSPLYHRNVEKLDQQDDNTATWLSSAQTLQFLIDCHPDMLGLIIYLFERLNMLLQACYFVDMWTAYLDSCLGYIQKPCKHIFGICRDIVKDFAMYDFYRMVPKLMVCIWESFLSKSRNERSADMKAHAAGYHHTYFDTEKLDIAAMSYFPTQEDIRHITCCASSKADSLIAALGISMLDLDDTGIWIYK